MRSLHIHEPGTLVWGISLPHHLVISPGRGAREVGKEENISAKTSSLQQQQKICNREKRLSLKSEFEEKLHQRTMDKLEWATSGNLSLVRRTLP